MVGLPGVAAREIARRQEMVQRVAVLIEEGDALMAKGDCENAVIKFRDAYALLPFGQATDEIRNQLRQRFCEAAVCQAKRLASEGRYEEADALLNEALTINPGCKDAEKLLEQLADPDRYPPALTPAHTERVREVKRLLVLGESFYLQGDYDNAEREFFKVLTIDRYNTAARMFLEKIERTRIDYYGAAYNHTRARMVRMVDEAWATKPPLQALPPGVGKDTEDQRSADLRAENSAALQEIIIPRVDFEGITLIEAINFLRVRAREADRRPGRPAAERGVNIIIRSPAAGPGIEATNYGEKQIPELRLTNTPLGEVLRYLCEATQLRIKIEQYAVVLVPITDTGADLYSRSFRVPPDFIPSDGEEAAGAAVVDDPFGGGGGGAGGGSGLRPRRNAKDYLESLGVPFPEGSSANFDGRTSTLTVRNTPQAMELIEQIVDDSFKRAPKQVTIETKFLEVQQRNGKELGFDWLLGPATVNTDSGVIIAGGTAGNGIPTNSANFAISDPTTGGINTTPLPLGRFPVTAGNRSGDFAVTRNGVDQVLNTNIAEVGNDLPAPGILTIAGLLSEPQFQLVIRALDQKKGTDLLSAPSVTTKSGLPAKIEIIREFIYPTEYDPPELPNTVGVGGGGGGGTVITPVQSFPVTPANPTAFETRNVGVTLDVEPVVGTNGYTVDLNLSPEVVEFEGFINYGTPIFSPAVDALGRPTSILITENRIEMPVFSTRRVKTQVTVWDGQTVAIGGLIREDVQDVEDKVPLLGDLPIVGRAFKSKSEERFKRNLMIFVTTRLIDPSGKPVNQVAEDESYTPPSVQRPGGRVNAGLIPDNVDPLPVLYDAK